ncbi:efflux RND transporter periplasmic adaptor subunit [Collimonas pratensis]|uniref:efflux RND transporter periplasmic adaptor subunit n=1 Tax=Collimonas pratensis TaxID=279113 RepID=UPI00143D6129|nr:efflux RND transporter periplasmic adaptor subunit [Collimonas pratensis]NKI70037.1 efflux RND transporter periplasmic adaptor subunit [Collimonas pratensis]
MKNKHIVVAAAIAALLGTGGYGLYRAGMQRGQKMAAPVPAVVSQTADAGKKVLYWHDPMVPGQKFDRPGKSPFMDMQLVPVYAGEAGDDGNVHISPRVQQNLGIRTAVVMRSNLASAVTVVGSVAYNERAAALVQARSNGFLERLYVRAPLDPVHKGQVLAEVYVPEWVAAQEEYLSVRRMQGNGMDSLLGAARQRMRLAGMSEAQIGAMEAGGKVKARLAILAPISGVVSELAVREGMTLMTGAPMFKINGLDTVWVNADVPEGLAAEVSPGNAVEARTPALPGTVFKGKVSTILPNVDPATRTLKARIELANPSGRLAPGMFATISFSSTVRKNVLLVPSEAVIRTGTRSVVMLAQGEGKFASAAVETGSESNGQTEIRSGLEVGQIVVVSGQFLIDSEASLSATETRVEGAGSAPRPATVSQAGAQTHRGEGIVERISKEEITISHGPIASLQWGAMTMGFKVPAAGLPGHIAVGDKVVFEIRPDQDGAFEIVTITPAVAAMKMPAVPAGAAQ